MKTLLCLEVLFPSPYGVSFILIGRRIRILLLKKGTVSVSLRSIIHSYYIGGWLDTADTNVSFRLLTEYHSFLFIVNVKVVCPLVQKQFPSPYGVSFILILAFLDFLSFFSSFCFRLLTEYHSFLFKGIELEKLINSNGKQVSVSLRSIIHSYKRSKE